MRLLDFVILDLEWNGSYSKRTQKFINEIFEFGAVRVNSDMEIVDRFSMLIKPQICHKICGRVKALTHIDPDELKMTNNTYNHVAKLFSIFAKDAVILTWGITDIQTLMVNNEYYNKKSELDFLSRYINLQSYCEFCLDKQDPSKQMGLSAAAEMLSIDVDDENLHRALDDSILSYKCFAKLYNKEKVLDFIQEVDSEFYRRITFKNTVITDFENPLIDHNELYALCPICNQRGCRLTNWQGKNRGFRATFRCDFCNGQKYIGKVQFKLKYEGIQVKHSSSIFENTENVNTQTS